jgi:amidohydrolase
VDDPRSRILAAVDALAADLIAVSHDIHARPELAFEEHFAADRIVAALEAEGLTPRRRCYGLATDFEAEFGSDGPRVAVLAELDALPGIGHACGHNLIATAALGAVLALHRVADELPPGRVRLLGTPAEERGCGKELMARQGAFDGVDAALMIHPMGLNLATMPCICVAEVTVEYFGLAAHASAIPHKGRNALDALLLAYQAVSNLRQHIRPTERIHGIITKGGDAPNIVPDHTVGEFYVRAANAAQLERLKARVQACFEAGALGSGCRLEAHWGEADYLDLNTCWPLAERFQQHAEALGRKFTPMAELGGGALGSTDMGNVSQRVPSIHPMLACAPPNVMIHNAEFARWAGAESGDAAALDGAKALALTAFDFLADATLRREARRAFEVARGLA